jgi:hypothetical protein
MVPGSVTMNRGSAFVGFRNSSKLLVKMCYYFMHCNWQAPSGGYKKKHVASSSAGSEWIVVLYSLTVQVLSRGVEMLAPNTFNTEHYVWGCIQKFPDWVDNEITINTRWEATWRVMAAKLTRLTHKIAIQLHPVAERCTICSSRSRRPVRKLLELSSYSFSNDQWRNMTTQMSKVSSLYFWIFAPSSWRGV